MVGFQIEKYPTRKPDLTLWDPLWVDPSSCHKLFIKICLNFTSIDAIIIIRFITRVKKKKWFYIILLISLKQEYLKTCTWSWPPLGLISSKSSRTHDMGIAKLYFASIMWKNNDYAYAIHGVLGLSWVPRYGLHLESH